MLAAQPAGSRTLGRTPREGFHWHLLSKFVPLLVLLALAGCATINLVSQYDEQTDQSITEFSKKIDAFLSGLVRNSGTQPATYDSNVSFYDAARVDIRAMQTRAQAIPQNDITQQQLGLLLDSLNDLEKLHKLKANGMITVEEITPLRNAFATQCGAILKFEIAKKRKPLTEEK